MSPSLQALRLPFDVFQTQKRMDDYGADDMQCGDLSELQLKNFYRLEKVSGQYDPWRAERTDFPISNYGVIRHKMRRQDVAGRLFDEFRRDATPFSFMGHRSLFLAMVNHFQYGGGNAFSSNELNSAYRRLIMGERFKQNSSVSRIRNFISRTLITNKGTFPDALKHDLTVEIANSFLPHFDRWQDKINGLGMSVHGIYATQIVLKSLETDGYDYRAVLQYKGQDHFGLDERDILDPRFHSLNIFRIWFILQRWQNFAYRPFFTNMEAVVTLTGN